MKAGLKEGVCQGHARCEAMSALLTVDDDGYSDIEPELDVPSGREDEVRRGIAACPEQALFEF
jgi:ferredoxin